MTSMHNMPSRPQESLTAYGHSNSWPMHSDDTKYNPQHSQGQQRNAQNVSAHVSVQRSRPGHGLVSDHGDIWSRVGYEEGVYEQAHGDRIGHSRPREHQTVFNHLDTVSFSGTHGWAQTGDLTYYPQDDAVWSQTSYSNLGANERPSFSSTAAQSGEDQHSQNRVSCHPQAPSYLAENNAAHQWSGPQSLCDSTFEKVSSTPAGLAPYENWTAPSHGVASSDCGYQIQESDQDNHGRMHSIEGECDEVSLVAGPSSLQYAMAGSCATEVPRFQYVVSEHDACQQMLLEEHPLPRQYHIGPPA